MSAKHLVKMAILGVFVASCGGKSDSDSTPSIGKTRYSKNPIKLTKQKINCRGAGVYARDVDIYISIEQLMDGALSQRILNFKGQIRANYVESIENDPVLDTFYGEASFRKFHAVYNQKKGGYFLKRGTKDEQGITAKPKNLSVCPGEIHYDRNTFEAAGLGIHYGITKTYNSIKHADSTIVLRPVTINVAPLKWADKVYEGGPSDYRDKYGYETDNAYYSSRKNEITFVPQSLEFQKARNTTIPFWEIPTVASHEYGHHVFRTLVLETMHTASVAKESDLIGGCFSKGHIHGLDDERDSVISSIKRDNGFYFALDSINEGFADLISFYSLSKDERSLKNVPCFEKNRSVDSSVFGDGSAKTFNSLSLFYINSETMYKIPRRACNNPNYQEIHDVGAIFAHQFDKVLSSHQFSQTKKLSLLLAWAKKFAENTYTYSSTEAGETFFGAIEILYSIVNQLPEVIDKTSCHEMKNNFEKNYDCLFLK